MPLRPLEPLHSISGPCCHNAVHLFIRRARAASTVTDPATNHIAVADCICSQLWFFGASSLANLNGAPRHSNSMPFLKGFVELQLAPDWPRSGVKPTQSTDSGANGPLTDQPVSARLLIQISLPLVQCALLRKRNTLVLCAPLQIPQC